MKYSIMFASLLFTTLFTSACISKQALEQLSAQGDGKESSASNKIQKCVILPASKIPLSPGKISKITLHSSADEIYESSPLPSQGVYLFQNFIFVVIVIKNPDSLKYPEGTAMLRSAALLYKHYPLPSKFRISYRQVLENGEDLDSGDYRYTVVFKKNEIEMLVKQK